MRSLLIALALAAPVLAGTYYVAPNGAAENDGSAARPWPSVEVALAKAGGGHTIVLAPGIYLGGINVARQFAGTADAPTVIRAAAKWKAVIVGAAQHGVYAAAAWVVVDGLEVTGARVDGIKIAGDHGVVRNCWVHNNCGNGVAIHGKTGWTIENCLIEFNGQHVQLLHGIYADGDTVAVRNNVIRHNSGYGIQLYPAARQATVVNNLIYGHARKGGMVIESPRDGGGNVIANNTLVENAYGISIHSGKGDVVVNNILVGPSPIQQDRSAGLVADYNLCSPACAQGPHGVTANPQFVDAAHGAYWLKPSSPARGAADPGRVPTADFWGRPRAAAAPADMGAFPFVPYLATAEARAAWHNGWAYCFSPNDARLGMPDLWMPPD